MHDDGEGYIPLIFPLILLLVCIVVVVLRYVRDEIGIDEPTFPTPLLTKTMNAQPDTMSGGFPGSSQVVTSGHCVS
jgi:hypothetical protein